MADNQIVLNRPPIKEAIFAISFIEAVDEASFDNFVTSEFLRSRFPQVFPLMTLEINHTPSEQAVDAKARPEGFHLKNDGRILQLKTTQLSYHCLEPYVGWDIMFLELKEIWDAFCIKVGKTSISQVSVRYINQINILNPIRLGDYLRLLPSLPPDVTPEIGNFFLQVNLPNKTRTLNAIVNEVLNLSTSGSNDKIVAVVLDINVIKMGPFDCNTERMWNAFTDIRAFKNHLFFSIITEQTKNMYL